MKDTALYPHEQILRWRGWSGVLAILIGIVVVCVLVFVAPNIGSSISSVQLSPNNNYLVELPIDWGMLAVLIYIVIIVMSFIAWLPDNEWKMPEKKP
jgi:uncharacterized BrkB/YihY/UPF0761 family membrane protein